MPVLLKHDYIATKQADYFSNLQNNLKEGEFLVTLDFSQNYTFKIQDAIQSHYWVNSQATIHPYVVYYKQGKEIIPQCFVIVGNSEKHDATAVHLFNKTLINYLKKKTWG